jgi:hypothetical protein
VHFIAVHYGLFRTDFLKIDNREASSAELVDVVARQWHLPADRIPELHHHFETAYKFTVYLGPLVLALLAWLWFRQRRPYFIQHLIFATHVYAFWFLLTPLSAGMATIRTSLAFVTTVYLYFAARHLYGGAFWTSTGRAVYLRIALIIAEMVAIGAALIVSLLWAFSGRPH